MSKILHLFLLLVLSCTKNTPEFRKAPVYAQGDYKNHHVLTKGHVVSSQNDQATRIGLKILEEGGNIIDAAVATSFMLSVVRPQSSGLGGGGFLLYYDQASGKTTAFDFRERAPARSTEGMFLKEDGSVDTDKLWFGVYSIAVPGLVRGLFDIHRRSGKLPWSKVVAPAIKVAEQGFPIYWHYIHSVDIAYNQLIKETEASRLFLGKDKRKLSYGDNLKQPDLARTLRIIAADGAKGFYEGEVARKIVQTVNERGGILNISDLRDYKMVTREPVEGKYRGFRILSMPPPSSGGSHIIQILNLLEPQALEEWGPQDPRFIHAFTQAMQISFADRATYMADPDFVDVPFERIISKDYAKRLQKHFSPRAISSDLFPDHNTFRESEETTHFTIGDREGNIVVSTQSINGWFGSGVVAKGTGVLMNNQMYDFTPKSGFLNSLGAIGAEGNKIAPFKRSISSMAPTIVFKDDEPYIALGTPSASMIISCIAQVLFNIIDYKLPLFDAVSATRVFHGWKPNLLRVEAPYLPTNTTRELIKRGHEVEEKGLFCTILAIMRKNNSWEGVADPRTPNLVLGSP